MFLHASWLDLLFLISVLLSANLVDFIFLSPFSLVWLLLVSFVALVNLCVVWVADSADVEDDTDDDEQVDVGATDQ